MTAWFSWRGAICAAGTQLIGGGGSVRRPCALPRRLRGWLPAGGAGVSGALPRLGETQLSWPGVVAQAVCQSGTPSAACQHLGWSGLDITRPTARTCRHLFERVKGVRARTFTRTRLPARPVSPVGPSQQQLTSTGASKNRFEPRCNAPTTACWPAVRTPAFRRGNPGHALCMVAGASDGAASRDGMPPQKTPQLSASSGASPLNRSTSEDVGLAAAGEQGVMALSLSDNEAPAHRATATRAASAFPAVGPSRHLLSPTDRAYSPAATAADDTRVTLVSASAPVSAASSRRWSATPHEACLAEHVVGAVREAQDDDVLAPGIQGAFQAVTRRADHFVHLRVGADSEPDGLIGRRRTEPLAPSLAIFSGGTATNTLCRSLQELTDDVLYIMPVSGASAASGAPVGVGRALTRPCRVSCRSGPQTTVAARRRLSACSAGRPLVTSARAWCGSRTIARARPRRSRSCSSTGCPRTATTWPSAASGSSLSTAAIGESAWLARFPAPVALTHARTALRRLRRARLWTGISEPYREIIRSRPAHLFQSL